jgi:probable F420-dependent oxidoreductase
VGMEVIRRLEMDDLSGPAQEAKRIESLGYDGLAAHELRHDTLLRLAVAANATENIGIESRLTIAFPRSPMVMAMSAWDLQLYSKGRFKLGVGTQVKAHNVRRFGIEWSPPGPRLRDYVLALRAIWSAWQNSTPLNYQSDNYTFTLMPEDFDPGPLPYPFPKVYIGGVNPYNLKLAGAIADGAVVLTMNSPEYIRKVVSKYVAEGARSVGRDPKSVKISGGGFVITGARYGEGKTRYCVSLINPYLWACP